MAGGEQEPTPMFDAVVACVREVVQAEPEPGEPDVSQPDAVKVG